MSKSKYFFLHIFWIITFSCGINKDFVKKEKLSHSIDEDQKIIEFIERDSVFINEVKRYYPDLNNCQDLNLFHSELVEPITLKYFDQASLSKTKYFKKYKDLDILEFKKTMKTYDSVYKSIPNDNKVEKNIKLNRNCQIKLSFSKKENNLKVIRYSINDTNIDPKINYKTRGGYYLIEFDKNGNIVQNLYVLKSN